MIEAILCFQTALRVPWSVKLCEIRKIEMLIALRTDESIITVSLSLLQRLARLEEYMYINEPKTRPINVPSKYAIAVNVLLRRSFPSPMVFPMTEQDPIFKPTAIQITIEYKLFEIAMHASEIILSFVDISCIISKAHHWAQTKAIDGQPSCIYSATYFVFMSLRHFEANG